MRRPYTIVITAIIGPPLDTKRPCRLWLFKLPLFRGRLPTTARAKDIVSHRLRKSKNTFSCKRDYSCKVSLRVEIFIGLHFGSEFSLFYVDEHFTAAVPESNVTYL